MGERIKAIVYAAAIRPGGGPAGYVWNLAEGSNSLDPKSSVDFVFWGNISGARTQDRGASEVKGIKRRFFDISLRVTRGRLWDVRDRMRLYLSSEGRRLLKLLASAHWLILHGPHSRVVLRAASRSGVRTMYMPHSPSPRHREVEMLAQSLGQELPGWRLSWEKRNEEQIIASVDYVVAPSQNAFSQYWDLKSVSKAKIHYVNSGAPDLRPQLSEDLSVMLPHFDVLFAGRFVLDKGFDIYLDAADLCRQVAPDIRWAAIGGGPLESLIGERVSYYGWQTDAANWIARASVLVIPNRVAYYDLLTLEGASLGKPMVLTPVGGNRDQARDLPEVRLATDVTPAALLDAVLATLEDLRARPDYGARNRSSFLSNFTVDVCAQQWNQLLLEIPNAENK